MYKIIFLIISYFKGWFHVEFPLKIRASPPKKALIEKKEESTDFTNEMLGMIGSLGMGMF